MKTVILFSLLSIPALQANNEFAAIKKSTVLSDQNLKPVSQPEPAYGRMSAIEFKSQEFCRADLKDFDFEARFSVISATVYFSGANFHSVEKGFIKSSSLKLISHLMNRCIPGSIVVFDDVKVKGPDNLLRTIPGVSYILY